MLSIFNLSTTKALADSLAKDFMQRAPLALVSPGNRGAKHKLEEAIRTIAYRAQEHTKKSKLGFFKKAYLANKIKWHLIDAGYHKEIIQTVVTTIIKSTT